MEQKNKGGRPKALPEERVRPRPVWVSPKQEAQILKKYESLTEALRSLLPPPPRTQGQ